ncbi:MAG: hypothetical protein IK129_07625 [Deltaproteobacteria bacterium]|nr:hypothetical protein [Deltaproteobacteria bacterium]
MNVGTDISILFKALDDFEQNLQPDCCSCALIGSLQKHVNAIADRFDARCSCDSGCLERLKK